VENVKAHIDSFHLVISHYRREDVPFRLYKSAEISLRDMHLDYKASNPQNCRYQFYMQTVNNMNILFVKLGEEECEFCLLHDVHRRTAVCSTTQGCDLHSS